MRLGNLKTTADTDVTLKINDDIPNISLSLEDSTITANNSLDRGSILW